jgi:hypothetical protein
MKLLIMQFSPVPRYFLSFRFRYFPQHPVLEHPLSIVFPYYERRSFTPIPNGGQSYTLLYFNICIFR